MLNFIFEKPFPLREKPSGTITLAATSTSDIYLGQDSRQDRASFIICNLSTTGSLKVRTRAHANMTTIFPQQTIALPTRSDVEVYNPNAGNVDYEVLEYFYDEGSPGPDNGGGNNGGNGGGVGPYAPSRTTDVPSSGSRTRR